MTNSSSKDIQHLLTGLMENRALFVHSFDFANDTALVLKVPEGFYEDAIFLDGRALEKAEGGLNVPLTVLLGIVKKSGMERTRADFIFHIGHSGSTLISRLLDRAQGVFGLREPMLFRMLAEARVAGTAPMGQDKTLLAAYYFLSRRFSPDQRTVIKTTSTCNCIAPNLLSFHKDNKALCVFTTLGQFLANMAMKDEPKDMFNFYAHCRSRILTRAPALEIEVEKTEKGKLIAVNWLGEILDLYSLWQGPDKARCFFIDFDKFLENREKFIGDITRFLDLKFPRKSSPEDIFSSYSKLPGFNYTPRDRQLNLEASKAKNRQEIEKGIAFVKSLAEKSSVVSKALEIFPVGD